MIKMQSEKERTLTAVDQSGKVVGQDKATKMGSLPFAQIRASVKR
jgi:hypothetical protein